MTVGLEESVTVPEAMLTEGTPTITTLTFEDGVTVGLDDSVTATLPAELPQKSPTLITWRCEVSACCTVWTSVAEDGVAGTELWNWTLFATVAYLTRQPP